VDVDGRWGRTVGGVGVGTTWLAGGVVLGFDAENNFFPLTHSP
jgi:hypothetical protein